MAPGFRIAAAMLLAVGLGVGADAQPVPQSGPEVPDSPQEFVPPRSHFDYEIRDVMIPMRDGVRLHTLVVLPKAAKRAPMLFTRTPYGVDDLVRRSISPHVMSSLPMADEVFLSDGYIRVYQDTRGKFGSEGSYVLTRPARGPLNTSQTDHSTDAYDSIEWLVKNVPESNGRVGMTGASYNGFTALMALIDPHPALRAVVPISPNVDGWMGDDWFHYGAFRQSNLPWFLRQTAGRRNGDSELPTGVYDDYDAFRRTGSAGAFAKRHGLDQLPFVQKILAHPSYDLFWSEQALDRVLARHPSDVPTMLVVSQWDQEDIYGAYAVYGALKARDGGNGKVSLVIGPWRHSGANYEGSSLGPLRLTGDTALQFRRDVMKPFLDRHLKDAAPAADTPPVLAYDVGANRWERFARWPLACDRDCPAPLTPLYLHASEKLAFTPSGGSAKAFDEYVSDPSKPVPFTSRPVRMGDAESWRTWLVRDQRPYSDRPDVLTYVSDPLPSTIHIAGQPRVDLYAETTGTDADWVVKLIDVYPDEDPYRPDMGGYQLGVAMDIFRGRYRNSFERPEPVPAGKVQRYRFALPNANHRFLKGHRIMVQIQSSWFPLYDRNPQRYVPNIFFAEAEDYASARQRIHRSATFPSAIGLPVVDD